MAKPKHTVFVIVMTPQQRVAPGTGCIALDGSTTMMRSKAAKFYSFADAKEFAKENHIAFNGRTYIGLEDFTD